jgi:hypothetical protein
MASFIVVKYYLDQSLILLPAFIAEKQQIPMLQILDIVLTRQGLKPTIDPTQGEYVNHYTSVAAVDQYEVLQVVCY